MKKAQTLLFGFGAVLFLVVVILISGFFAGSIYQKNRAKEADVQVNSTTIIDKINSEAFLVTKTVFIDQEAEIVIDKGSKWSNFFWGQNIQTEALVRIDIGVDLKELEEKDIKVDHQNKKITIKLQDARVLDANVTGDIEVVTQNGVFKYIFDNDPNEDHNLATSELVKKATEAISTNEELFVQAKTDSKKLLQVILADFEYEVEIN